MKRSAVAVILAAFCVFAVSSLRVAYAAPPTDGCSLLTAAQIQKVLGQPFSAPNQSKALPAYGRQPWGSHCEYASQKGSDTRIVFIVYEDASAPVAKQTFDKLSMWYPPKSKPTIGDSAYIDTKNAIHVLKGKVRYYISIDPENEKQLKDLAASVAAQI